MTGNANSEGSKRLCHPFEALQGVLSQGKDCSEREHIRSPLGHPGFRLMGFSLPLGNVIGQEVFREALPVRS